MDRDWSQHVFRPGEEAIMVFCFFMSEEKQGGVNWHAEVKHTTHGGSPWTQAWGASQATVSLYVIYSPNFKNLNADALLI